MTQLSISKNQEASAIAYVWSMGACSLNPED